MGNMRLLAFLTSFALLLGFTTLATVPAAAASEQCQKKDFAFVSVRGTGEAPGTGDSLADVLSHLKQKLGVRATIEARAVEYPAQDIPWIIASASTLYYSSVDAGVASLRADLSGMLTQCSGTRFLLGGYSQGAHVVTKFLDSLRLENELDAALANRVVGVGLLGSPLFTPADGPVVNVSPVGSQAYSIFLQGLLRRPLDVAPSIISSRPWNQKKDVPLTVKPVDVPPTGPGAITARRVSVGPGGTDTTCDALVGAVSNHGRWVAFTSSAPEHGGSPNGSVTNVVVVADTISKLVTTIQGSSGVRQTEVTISGDGNVVAFAGRFPGRIRDAVQIYDRAAATSTILTDRDGQDVYPPQSRMFLSDDGRYLAFTGSGNISPEVPQNPVGDPVWRFDRMDSSYRIVSVNNQGDPGESQSYPLAMNSDGSQIVFFTGSTNIPERGAANGDGYRAFHRDLSLGRTFRSTFPAPESNSVGLGRDGRWATALGGDGIALFNQDDQTTQLIPKPPEIPSSTCGTPRTFVSNDATRFAGILCEKDSGYSRDLVAWQWNRTEPPVR